MTNNTDKWRTVILTMTVMDLDSMWIPIDTIDRMDHGASGAELCARFIMLIDSEAWVTLNLIAETIDSASDLPIVQVTSLAMPALNIDILMPHLA